MRDMRHALELILLLLLGFAFIVALKIAIQ